MEVKKLHILITITCLLFMIIMVWLVSDQVHQMIRPSKALKKIVLWNTFFGSRTWYVAAWPKGSLNHHINCSGDNRCLLSIDTRDPLQYDAVIFHGRNFHTPPLLRHPRQVYVISQWESPVYTSTAFVHGAHFYNWTQTYSHRSDLTLLHAQILQHPQTPRANFSDVWRRVNRLSKTRLVRNGTKTAAMVAWIVSNCHAYSKRNEYVKHLRRHIAIDVFGKCGKPCPRGTSGNSPTCYHRLALTGRYKFYLAFENSACEDYVSYKPYRAMEAGYMIPIVLGGLHAKDYIKVMPPNSYLDVRNFTSDKQLAEKLLEIDADEWLFRAYHAWRWRYSVAYNGNDFCHLCNGLFNQSMVRPRNVDWAMFWNHKTMCDANLVKKLLTTPYHEVV